MIPCCILVAMRLANPLLAENQDSQKSCKMRDFANFEDSSDCIPLQKICHYNVSIWYFKYF